MACINPNSPEFKAALERTGNPLLAEIDVDSMFQLGKVPQNEYTYIKESTFFQLDKKKLPSAQEKLDNQLLTFLGQFGVTTKEVDNFNKRFGVDALGATDIMQKLIYLSSRRNITTVPEEAAHMMVILMGKNHPLIKEAFANIESWSGYSAVEKQYMPIYKDENKVKIEALGHLIRDAVVKKYTSENPLEKSLFQKVKDLIESFLKNIRDKFGVRKNDGMVYDKQAVMKIAEGMLLGDVSLITSQRSFKWSTNVDYYKALEKDSLSKEIVDAYTEKLPFKLSGSLAIAKQTNIERWRGEPIHDLDFKVPKTWIDENGEEEFDRLMDKPNIVKLREIRNEYSSYHTKSYLQAPRGYRIQINTGRINASAPMLDISVYDEKGNKLSVLDSIDKIKTIDFFIGGENEEVSFENVTSWQDVFQGKLSLSPIGESELMFDRPKDQTDYINVIPVNLQESKEKNLYFQTEDISMSRVSKETLNKVKEVAKKMGIDIQSLTDYAKAHPEMDLTNVNGVADLVRGTIAVADGKEDVAITEEMVHIATAIIEQTNPKLVTEMISKIDRFKIYKQTLKEYKDNKEYQLPNGKPDIRKIKKEAVDKLIAELIVNGNQGNEEFPELMEEVDRSTIRNWWSKILDWIKGIYKKSNISIFEEVAATIMGDEIVGTVDDIIEKGIYFQLSDAQKNIQQKIVEGQGDIRKVVSDEKPDPMLMDTEEASNYYETKNADGSYTRVKKRVTDRVKAWYRQRFPGKTFTKEEKAFNELKRTLGVQGHKDFEEIHARYFNSDGSRRAKPEPRSEKFNLQSREMYDTLEKYYVELIDSIATKAGGDVLVFSEVMLFDKKDKEAGTIDLMIVEPSGKTHIVDWKFMQINGDDVAWFKQGAFNIQLGRYKEMLRNNYGIKQFGMNRAVPIAMDIGKLTKDKDAKVGLKGIAIGSVDASKITDIRLLPVSEETESTGFEKLDAVLRDMNAILNQIAKKKVVDEEERELKVESLNALRRAIRLAQGTLNIGPLISVIQVMRKEGERIISDYDASYKNRPAMSDDSNNKELSDFAFRMKGYLDLAEVFGRIDDQIGNLIYNPSMDGQMDDDMIERRKETLKNLSNEARMIRFSREELKEVSKKFADKHIGERNLVTGLLLPEPVVKGLSSMFRGVSELPNAALQILYKLTANARDRASQDALGEVNELMEIRKKLAERGGDLRKLVQRIYQKEDNKLVNKLIRRFSKEFYETVDKKAADGGDKSWLMDNIDVEAYKKEAYDIMNKAISKIEKETYEGAPEEQEDTKERYIAQLKQKWDITREDFNGWNNYVIKRHPLSKWESKEYLDIKSDPELLGLYNFISKINNSAKDMGYIQNKVASTFLPFIRKSMAESLAWDFGTSAAMNFTNNLTIQTDDVGYGSVNEVTGELENSIPKYYTYDFTAEGGENNYSDVSEDLFKNMILYIQQVQKYKYLSDVEGQISLLKTVETFKNHYKTSRTGDVVYEDGRPKELTGNEENTMMFDLFTRSLLYEQKYPLSDSDTPLGIGKVMNFMKKAVNGVAGKEIFSISDKPNATSLVKTMDAANRAFQLKTLGLEFISGAVNMFGGNIQLATQAGNYFKAREVLKNEFKLIGNKFSNSEEREMFVQLVDLFMPLKDDPSYEKMKKAGMTALTRRSFSDMLMVFMREPEQHIEKSIFLTLLENTMVVDGRIVSIAEEVRKKYKGRTNSSSAYRESKVKIEAEIEELKKTKSIYATKKLEKGKLVIPGLDVTNSDELQRLTNLTRRISRNATGGMSDSDMNKMQMSVWTRSMMIFKNWIPKLVDTRFSEFRKVSDDFSVVISEDGTVEGEKYDIGRMRLWFYVMGTSLRDKTSNVLNILNMNDKGMALIDQMYEEFSQNYEKSTGKPMNMSKEDFTDMVRTNLRNQMKEVAVLLSLFGTAFSLGFAAPDDDDDKATKNFFRYSQKVVDKFVGELSFFYNPAEFHKILSGSMFPALGMFTDISKFTTHTTMQLTGLDISDPEMSADEVREKAMPIKYGAKMLPVTKSLLTYGAILDAEFAKEFDITIQKESRR